MGNLEADLKRTTANEMKASEEEARIEYEENWRNISLEPGWIWIEKLFVEFMPSGSLFKSEARDLMVFFRAQALAGTSFTEINDKNPEVSHTYQHLDLRRGSGREDQHASIEIARDMEVDEISEMYEDLNSFAVLRVLDRNDEEFRSFELLYVNILQYLAEQKFAAWIDELIENAVIAIDESVLEIVKMNIINT